MVKEIKTIELIVERPEGKKIPANKIVSMQKVKMLGGRWNSKEKVWKIAYGKVKILNLEERVVEDTEKK